MREQIARLLGGAISEGAPAVRAQVRALSEGWRLRLRVGAQGERRLEAARCELLAEATALIVALAIDPVRVAEATDTTPALERVEAGMSPELRVTESEAPASEPIEPQAPVVPQAPVEPQAPVVPQDDPAPERDEPAASSFGLQLAEPRGVPGEALVRPEEPDAPERVRAVEPPVRSERASRAFVPQSERAVARASRPRVAPSQALGVSLVVAAELGALPEPSAALGVELAAAVGRFVLEPAVLVAIPRDSVARDSVAGADSAVGARLGLGLARLAVARPFALDGVRLAPRGVVEIGVTGGRGFGISNPERGLTLWAAVGGGASIDVSLGRRGRIGVAADALVPLWRPAFAVEPVGPLHRAAPVVGRLSLRASVYWR